MAEETVMENESVCLPIDEDASLVIFIDGEEAGVSEMFDLLLAHAHIPKVLASMKRQLRAFGHDVQITRGADANLCKRGWKERAESGM